MPPNLDDSHVNIPSPDLVLFMAPLLPNGPLSSDEEIDSGSDEEAFDTSQVHVPLEHNLRGLLVQVCGTEELARVTQLKLRVIARDVPLQHLSEHIPCLRELILDGSVISTFRDLGTGLRNLKILRVNRCGLECLDGMLTFEGLEELYAADNAIEDCMPCSFLSNVKIIDLRRNRLKNLSRSLTFLTVCEKLEHIHLEGNDEIRQFPNYRQTVKSLLPALRSLDGVTYIEGPGVDDEMEQNLTRKTDDARNNLDSSATADSDVSTGFTIRFPPNVFLGHTRKTRTS